jgi:hypothetical protein
MGTYYRATILKKQRGEEIHLGQDMDQQKALVNTVMNLGIS